MSIQDIREKHIGLIENTGSGEADVLAPSRIANQFYCEKKVDLTFEHGDIETPEKTRGSETHEKAAEDAEEVSEDEFWDALEHGDRQIILESPFVGETEDFLLAGYPDAIQFEDQRPTLLFERKTTSRPDYLFKNQRIQAWLYGYILESLGFDTDGLTIAILSHERSLDTTTGKDLQAVVMAESDAWGVGTHELFENPTAILHVSAYQRADFEDDLKWALGYWRDDRDPIPTKKPAKCRACEYKELCPASKA